MTPEQLATAMEEMAVNPKGGKMAAIAYRHCARLIREKLDPPYRPGFGHGRVVATEPEIVGPPEGGSPLPYGGW